MDKRKQIFKILYNITCVIAWVLLFIDAYIGLTLGNITAFWIIMGVLTIDVVLQIAFWYQF